MIETGPTSSDRIAAILTHIGGIFFCFVPALIVYLVAADNPWLKENARSALNFQLTMVIAWIISGILVFFVIGIFLAWAIEVLVLVLSIVAAVKASAGETYAYPLSLALIKS